MLFDPLTRQIEFVPGWSWPLLHVAWVVGGTLFLLMHQRKPVTTIAWLLAFWSLPILSGIAYFLFGPRRLDREKGARQTARAAAERGSPARRDEAPEGFDRQPLAAIARAARGGSEPNMPPSRAKAIELHESGETLYPALERAIEAATDTLHLEYYIWQPDGIGTRLRDALARRAAAGVTVRLLTDSIGAKNCTRAFWQPLVEAGAQLRTFNPPRLLLPQPGKMNFRTHRKILVADGRVGFVGGINVSDDNTSGTAGRGNEEPWRSTHARLEGHPVRELQRVLLEDWLYGLPLDRVKSGHKTAKALLSGEEPALPDDLDSWFPELPEPASGPWVQIIDSGPDEEVADIRNLYFTAVNEARRRLWITTPYFVPDEPMLTALRMAAARGVDVRVILPQDNDSKMVKAAARTYSEAIIETGAKVFMFQNLMNHSKTMVVDDTFAVVGTANMDNRSFQLNFEVVAAIWDEDVNERLAELFGTTSHARRPSRRTRGSAASPRGCGTTPPDCSRHCSERRPTITRRPLPLGFQSLGARSGLPPGCADIATFARTLARAREQGVVSINATIRADRGRSRLLPGGTASERRPRRPDIDAARRPVRMLADHRGRGAGYADPDRFVLAP